MNDQKEFAQLLAYLTGSKSEQELEAAITTIGEEGLKKLAAHYEQLKSAYNEVEQKKVMDEMKLTCEEYLTKKAKFGAKLNYIQALKNRCPEGTELYRAGGIVECRKCGGKAKAKVTGKKRFAGGGEMDDSELAYSQRMAGANIANPRTRGTKTNPVILPEVSNEYIPQTGWEGPYKNNIMEIPGSYTIVSETYSPTYGSKRFTYDFDTNEVGRMIVSHPKMTPDTVYFTSPIDYIMGKGGFAPVGADKDQNKAKARFKEAETKASKNKKK